MGLASKLSQYQQQGGNQVALLQATLSREACKVSSPVSRAMVKQECQARLDLLGHKVKWAAPCPVSRVLASKAIRHIRFRSRPVRKFYAGQQYGQQPRVSSMASSLRDSSMDNKPDRLGARGNKVVLKGSLVVQRQGIWWCPRAARPVWGTTPGLAARRDSWRPASGSLWWQGQFGGGGGNPAVQQGLMSKLQQIIQSNRLEAFYPPPKLQQLVNRLQQLDFRSLAAKYNMPMNWRTALPLLPCTTSSSMLTTAVLWLLRRGGQLISQVNFNGMTPLGTNLTQKIIQPFLMGDGEPTGEPQSTVGSSYQERQEHEHELPYGPGAIAFEFAQVGKDQAAQAFLGQLDRDPEVGRMIDATSYYELEAEEYKRKGVMLTPDLWLVKLMVGAVDQSFDEQD
ncbi:MAG: hypothetical protein FRX48_09837 [Lasallia pustulata]|uniref:Uncharacterized protein n=1 Tax=Lasallia pustulata TaxID=136370 RepID=A0A5M8PC86_9LECA|nr:MAG: hypothetical protein FRX48_09837 [Lasallia pustulata]